MSARQYFSFFVISTALLTGCSRPPSQTINQPQQTAQPVAMPTAGKASQAIEGKPYSLRTKVLMHNVVLTERPGFHLRVRWLRGDMYPTDRNITPSFDDPKSFVINVEAGVIATSLSEISALFNGGLLAGSPLEHISLSDDGKQLKLNGTLHKGVSFPIEMISNVGVSADGRIALHVVKLRVLKLPVKGLLQAFHVKLDDIVGTNGGKGVQVAGDDMYLDPSQMIPAPALRGKLADAHLGSKTGDLITVFGNARPEVNEFQDWRNFIRLFGGTLNFGKLTMTQTDLFLIDASQDDWFEFDLTRYQEQLVNGRIQMTPQAGLRIYMPDIQKIPSTAANQAINLQWMKNRNLPPPADVRP